jgi:hypothetical protein
MQAELLSSAWRVETRIGNDDFKLWNPQRFPSPTSSSEYYSISPLNP